MGLFHHRATLCEWGKYAVCLSVCPSLSVCHTRELR